MLTFLLIPFVSAALPLCEDNIEIYTNCTMATPIVTGCSVYNYTIYRTNNTIEKIGTLAALQDNLYYFNCPKIGIKTLN